MSDRDIIAAHSFIEYAWGGGFCECGHTWNDQQWREHHALHADHVVAAIREARTVRTVGELNALPHLSVVREGGKYGSVWERHYGNAGWKYLSGTFTAPVRNAPQLPALVLYRPDEDGIR
ncbi:hypothetical protein GCM10022231_23890 [Gordonia caeni]|uniref:Uncharacterized protein n=2 Tax=Gordonia caeni TaxID=1007097 RepID=A0ABP7PBI7_9ACTN